MICSFFGDRTLNDPINLKNVEAILRDLIVAHQADTFYFGGYGEFDELCYQLLSRLKEEYPHIQRVYVLTDEQYLTKSKRPKSLRDEDYEQFIYLPLDTDLRHRRLYLRDLAIIDESDFVVFYLKRYEHSDARKAYGYAQQKKKSIFLVFA